MATRITTIRDLKTWVADHAGPDATATDIEIMVETIRDMPDCPAYGTDWAEWLDSQTDDWLTEVS